MAWDDNSSPQELEAALSSRRYGDAERIVNELIVAMDDVPWRMEQKAALSVLAALRGAAWFEPLYRAAECIEGGGQDDPAVIGELAQAMIEQGRATGAIARLGELRTRIEEMLAEPGIAPDDAQDLEYELGETLGRLGRAYKQLYVDAMPTAMEPRSYDLKKSIEWYEKAYRERLGDYRWHGINYIALRTHGERVRRKKQNLFPACDDAKSILEALEKIEIKSPPLKPWDLANRLEALLACGRGKEEIEDAIAAYLDAPGLNAFNVQSTRRQFVEVWGLREDEGIGRIVLPMMTARLAQLGGTPDSLDLTRIDGAHLEAIYGDTSYQPLKWLHTALSRAAGVARLGPNKYEGWGTGFVFDGSWIGPAYADKKLLLTNAHVCSNDPNVQLKYPYPKGHKEQTAVFLGLGDEAEAHEIEVSDLVWSSPPDKLDATLLELASVPEQAAPPPMADLLPTTEGPGARVNVIGHPKGFGVRVALQDNQVTDVGDPYIRYKTPTDPGSSGSPVFNQDWELVALHHASSDTHQANEGIRFDRLVDAMKADLA